MLEQIKSKLDKLKQSKEWKKDSSILNSILIGPKLQFNFYNPKKDNMTIYTINDKITKEESDIFRKEKHEMKELDLEKVKIDLEKINEEAKKIVEEKYKNTLKNQIIILQQKEIPVFVITCITHQLNVLILIIDATNHKILEEKFESILKFKK